MLLKTHQWGPEEDARIVCIHGLSQHGRIYESMGRHLAAQGHSVLAVDLRAHGRSGSEPPWNVETHVGDVRETLAERGVERALLIGHSFGGRVAAALAAADPELVRGIALLETPHQVKPDRALRAIEIERLDWSFATVDGAVEAMLASELMSEPPREVVTAFVNEDVRRGPDGRFRFRVSPGAVVVAWSEMTLLPPPIASVPTLLLSAASPLADSAERDALYEEALGDLQTQVRVPKGHNVLWEAPEETTRAIENFLVRAGWSQG